MRVNEETLNRGWVCMGWWVSGLLVGASKYENTIFLILTFHAILRWRLLHVSVLQNYTYQHEKDAYNTTTHQRHLYILVCLQYHLRVPSSVQQSSATIYSHQVRT